MLNSRTIFIVLGDPLLLAVTMNPLMDAFTLGGMEYSEVAHECETTVVFYDWLVKNMEVVGLELHESPQFIKMAVGDGALSFDYSSVYPRLWFGHNSEGEPIGCEAFGDIHFFQSRSSNGVIVVSIDEWLPPDIANKLFVSCMQRED